MKHKYQSIKSGSGAALFIITIMIIAFAGILLPIINNRHSVTGIIIMSCIVIAFAALFLWVWFKTNYTISNDKLTIKSGPFRYNIDINKIREVKLNQKTIGGTLKFTLAWDCINIYYKKFGFISISPNREEEFLKAITSINSEIDITT